MKNPPSKSQPYHFRPYVFMLKEGKEIHENYLDYSLWLLQVAQVTVIPSPNRPKNYRPLITMQF